MPALYSRGPSRGGHAIPAVGEFSWWMYAENSVQLSKHRMGAKECSILKVGTNQASTDALQGRGAAARVCDGSQVLKEASLAGTRGSRFHPANSHVPLCPCLPLSRCTGIFPYRGQLNPPLHQGLQVPSTFSFRHRAQQQVQVSSSISEGSSSQGSCLRGCDSGLGIRLQGRQGRLWSLGGAGDTGK